MLTVATMLYSFLQTNPKTVTTYNFIYTSKQEKNLFLNELKDQM